MAPVSDSLFSWALRYAAKGWAVLPLHSFSGGRCSCGEKGCRSPAKHPRSEHGVDDASTDETTITEWWLKWPGANIGLAAGEPSGLWVLDVDRKAPKTEGAISGIRMLELLEEKSGRLPPTLEVATGGGGRHLFFKLPTDRKIKNRVSVKGPNGERTGLDARASGGYVVLPPSIHASGTEYRWAQKRVVAEAPDWLLDAIAPIQVERSKAPLYVATPPEDADRNARYAAGALQGACRRILEAPEGERHIVLIREASIIGGYVVAGHLAEDVAAEALAAAGKQAGKPSKEVERTVRDGLVLGRDTPRHAPPLPDRARDPRPDDKAPPPSDEDLGVDHTLSVRRRLHLTKPKVDKATGEYIPGYPLVDLHNAVTILEHDPCYAGRLRWDRFAGAPEIDLRPLIEPDVIGLRAQINDEYRVHFGKDLAHDAVRHVATLHGYDPLEEYLCGLRWDGTARIAGLLHHYFGSPDTALNERYSARWMIAAVARAFQPGCKVDTVLVLRGVQAAKKSTGLAALVPVREWFSDSDVDVQSKEGAIAIQGKWIVEIAELESFRGKAQTAIKAFLSREVDHFRSPYDRQAESHKRRTIFVASTNAETFLGDPTGSRRFWVVEATKVDVAMLTRDRDQLWAEAVHAYKAGEQWWLTPEEEEERKEASEVYQIQEPWEPVIGAWLVTPEASRLRPSGITTADVMQKALALDPARMTRNAEMDVANILRRMGMDRRRAMVGGVRAWRFFDPA